MKIKKSLICFLIILLTSLSAHSATDDFSKVSKLVQSFKVESFLGAGSTAIPIAVPPGRRGLEPQISPAYSSSSGNGWIGVGWSLDFGQIVRLTSKGIPKYDSTDKFYISFMGISSELGTSSSLPNEYYPKTTSFFVKLLFRGSYWEAYDKEGKKYTFGSTSDSRIDLPKGTFSWSLNKITDTCGNYLTIKYFKDIYQIYPYKIEYNGNELTSELPTHRVDFILEDRQDIISSYRSGYNITTNKRLKEIKTYAGSNLANRFLFDYTYSRQTGRSLLAKFTSFGSDGLGSLPPMVFTYQDLNAASYKIVFNDGKVGNRLWCIDKSFGMYGNASGALQPKTALFTGGGYVYWQNIPEIKATGDYWSIDEKGKLAVNLPAKAAFHAWTYVYVDTAKTISIPVTGSGYFYFWLNSDYTAPASPQQINLKAGSNLIEITGYNTTGTCSFNLNYALSDNVVRMHSNQFMIPQLSGDFNGDGLADLATYYASSGRIKVGLSNGTAFQTAEYWPIIPNDGFPKYMTPTGMNLLLGNFDGDTLTDIRAINDSTQCELITAGNKLFEDEGGGGPVRFPVKGNSFAADFNGDGITDIGIQAVSTNDILIALCSPPYNIATPKYWLYGFAGKILIGDFNGDGLLDLASFDSAQAKISVALNKGDSFDTPKSWITGFNPGETPGTTDANGDGLADICYYNKTTGQLFVAASDGNKFLAPIQFLSNFTIKDPDVALQSSDFNGDGASDFYIFNPYTQKTEISYSTYSFTDLLYKVENGIGGQVLIKYDTSGNYDNTITTELKKDIEYRYLSGCGLPFSVPLVKEISTSDVMGNSYSTSYSYGSGFFDRNDREFRGFGYVRVTDIEGNQKEIYFKQNDIFKGRPYLENYKDNQGRLYIKVEKSWASQSMMTHAGNYNMYAGHFVYLAQEKRFSYDGDSTYKTANSSYSYSLGTNDQYVTGDLTVTSDWGDSTSQRTRTNKYVRAIGDSILSRPSYSYLFSSNVLAKKWLYYDNSADFNSTPTKGLLTKEKICLASGDVSPLEDKDPANAPVTTYAYDIYGNLITVTDPESRVTTTTFDSTYHIFPIEVKNALGQSAKNTYDFKTGQILTSTDANNQITTYVYDNFGRLIKFIGSNDTVQYPGIIYQYDLSSCPIKVTKQYKTAYSSTYSIEYNFYDGFGRLIETKVQAEDLPGTTQARQIIKDAVTFNQQGKVKDKFNPYFVNASSVYSLPSISIPKASFEYDSLGRIIKIINPDLTYRTIQYSDWVQTKTDENGHQSRSTYDALRRLIKQEEFNAGNTYITQYAYDVLEYDLNFRVNRKVFKITDNNSNITKIFYDLADRKVRMDDPDMGSWYYTFDKAGNLKTQKDAKALTITFTYDAINRVTKKAYPDARSIAYYYDDAAKSYCKGRLSYVTDLAGRTDYYYDNLGRQVKVTKAIDGIAYAFERGFNALNQVTALKYPDGEIVNYTYGKGNAVDKISNSSIYVNNVDYAPAGQIQKISFGNNTYTDYTYDSGSLRLTDIKTNNGALQNFHYQYDSTGNISHITDYRNSATQDFIYDDLNRLMQANGAYGNFGYQYDALGNMTYKEGVSYSYGSAKPHALTYGSDGFNAVYDANGNMVSKAQAALTYDYDNRLTKIEPAPASDPVTVEVALSTGWNFVALPLIVDNSSVTSVLSSIASKYDQVSRYNPVTLKFEHFVNNATYNQFSTMEAGKGYQIYVTTACTLKLTGRLLTSNYNISLSGGWQMIGCIYKGRVKVSEALNNLVKGVNYDRISRFDKVRGIYVDLLPADYLEAGQAYFIRLLKSSTWTVLPKADAAVVKNEFTYDADGNRVKKIVNSTTTTIYIGNLYEKTGSLITKYVYLGENRVASKSGTTVYYYHPDHLGSTNLMTNSSGAQAQLSEYKPYGELARNTAQLTKHYFTGKELDSTGLYYYGARYYDPKIGRFITADNFIAQPYNPQYLNRYSYCMNNPLRYIDPTGNSSQDSVFNWINNPLPPITQLIWDTTAVNLIATYNLSLNTWQQGKIFGSALGMGMDYGLGIVGGIISDQLTYTDSNKMGRWWPKFINDRIPNYGVYGGPSNSDPTFRKAPQDSMDAIFMQHDYCWSQGKGRFEDVVLLVNLVNLPFNPNNWEQPPSNILKASIYREMAIEIFGWSFLLNDK